MTFTPLSGIVGSVTVGAVVYAFGKWRLAMDNDAPVVNNFTSAYQQLVKGVTKATLTLDGPYDSGNMPLTAGNTYAFVLYLSGSVSIAVTALVTNITPSQDIDDAARVTVTAKSTGSFTAAIV